MPSGEDRDLVGDVGLDAKVGLSSNFTLDLTLNTDFAQVEADNVQINLSRFDLFYPEKREFFLERAGLFSFGDPMQTEIFFSRRIGIDNDILGGVRLTGQTGRHSIGLMSLQTGDSEELAGANNSVARLRTDLASRTTVGAIFTNLQSSAGYNRVAGVDGTVRFGSSSHARAWFARVWDSEAGTHDNYAGSVELNLGREKYWGFVKYTDIGEAFDPKLGFVQRRDQVRWNAQVGFRPRFEGSRWARRVFVVGNAMRVDGHDGYEQTHTYGVTGMFFLRSDDVLRCFVVDRFERLVEPFEIRPGTVIPPGEYSFIRATAGFRTNMSRRLSGYGDWFAGSFYNGKRDIYMGGMSWKQSEHLSFSANFQHNVISLPVENGNFTTSLVGLRVGAAATRSLFADALIQYDTDSDEIQTYVRVDWIHKPGSDLFVVFDSGYQTGVPEDPHAGRWNRRSAVVKLTYLITF